jgi:UDP-N-acetylglucosamine 4,6-dehydratase
MRTYFLDLWRPISDWLQLRDQNTKAFVFLVTDFLFLVITVLVSYILRISSFSFPENKLLIYFAGPVLSISFLALFGIYRSVSRNYSAQIEKRIFLSQLLVPPLWALILIIAGTTKFPRSIVGIYFVISIFILIALRRGAAWLLRIGKTAHIERNRIKIPVVIFGAGREGIVLADSLNSDGRYRPMAFIDTDYTLVGRTLAGLRVYSSEQIPELVRLLKPQQAMIAKPQQNRATRRALVEMLIDNGLLVKTIPALNEIVEGKIDVNALQPVRLEDLLGRDPVPPNQALMEKAVKGQVVMVTGAGGSIGSELVRQIFAFSPEKILLVDNSEFGLFEIHREMEALLRSSAASSKLVPLLADVQNSARMTTLMQEHQVTVVLHAAAYKHVRMVQENAAVGIQNNIWGTKSVAEAAIACGVGLFIFISTDKAVRPTSIMGATKRVAEMVVQALADTKGCKTVFAIVRFGNVLGSTGSVIPLFREQIARGGPVLVTDPEVTRFFMLIPEAAQLVIQAGAMANRAEVFVLDMGEPIKIVNLAETMIELAGLTRKTEETPDGDIEINFIGLRDGEKLYEELQIGNNISETPHPRIMRCQEFFLSWKELNISLNELQRAAESGTSTVMVKDIFHLAGLDNASA